MPSGEKRRRGGSYAGHGEDMRRFRERLLGLLRPVAKPPDVREMGVHCPVERFVGRDDLGFSLKTQGKEEGIVHAPPVLDCQAVGGHEEGGARGDLEGDRKEGRNDRRPVLGTTRWLSTACATGTPLSSQQPNSGSAFAARFEWKASVARDPQLLGRPDRRDGRG